MANRSDLVPWVHEAVKQLGGSAPLVKVAKEVWAQHESEIRQSGDMFYTWQYDMRWAAQNLRRRGLFKPWDKKTKVWEIA